MGGEKVTLDLADLKDALPAAAAALSAKDRVGFLDTLKSLADEYTDMVETFSPNVIKRVEFLREIQRQYDEIEVKFFEERTVLEAKYQKLYEPLYTKRYEIVNGVVEADGVSDEPTSENAAERKESDAKGVPAFWLTAMKTNDALAAEIQERDEPALKYMKDIKWSRIKDLKGFKLEFFFDTNPLFKNSVLTKTYHMVEEYDLILEKAAGTEIEWYPRKNLTQKIIKKKPKKGSKNAKRIIKTKACDSFFNFFSPPLIPDDGVEIDDADELRGQMEHDYDIGIIIRYKIIPHAVSWFTSEAVESKDFEDTDDGDDDEEEDDEAEESKPMKKVPQKVGSQAE